MSPRLSVVIVTYNSINEIEECLSGLSGLDTATAEIVIVDNASQDGTAAFIEKYQQNPQYHIILNEKNTGFAEGATLGISSAKSDVVLSINPDTTVSKESVLQLLNYFEVHPEVGILGPKITDEYGTVQESYGETLTPLNELKGKILQSKYMERIPTIKRWKIQKLNRETTLQVGWIGGACFMMRKSVYLKVGGINQQFFLSHADLIDLSKKVSDLGFKNVLLASAVVVHKGGKSSVGDRDAALRASYIGTLYFFKTHYGSFTVFFAKIVYVVLSSIKSIIAFLISLYKKEPYRAIALAHFKNAYRITTGTLGSIS